MLSAAGLLFLAFSPPTPAPSPAPTEPLVDSRPTEPTVDVAPGGSTPVPARPTSPPSAPSSPGPTVVASEATGKPETRKSRRQRRLSGHGFVGRERANMFQSHVPDNWDATVIINTDRPDFTDALPTIGHRVTYIESGYNFVKPDHEDPGLAPLTHMAPDVLLRYGLHDRVELRLKATPGIVHDRLDQQLRLIGEHYAGFKIEVFRQKGWLPGHTLVPVVNILNGVKEDGGHLIAPELGWVYGWQVRKWIAFRGSTGVSGAPHRFTFGAGPGAGYLEVWQSVSIYWHLHRVLGVHSEWIMFAEPLLPRADRISGVQTYGIYLYPTPEVLIDVRVGDTLGATNSSWYLGGGVSVRIKPLYASRAERRKARQTGQPAPTR